MAKVAAWMVAERRRHYRRQKLQSSFDHADDKPGWVLKHAYARHRTTGFHGAQTPEQFIRNPTPIGMMVQIPSEAETEAVRRFDAAYRSLPGPENNGKIWEAFRLAIRNTTASSAATVRSE